MVEGEEVDGLFFTPGGLHPSSSSSIASSGFLEERVASPQGPGPVQLGEFLAYEASHRPPCGMVLLHRFLRTKTFLQVKNN